MTTRLEEGKINVQKWRHTWKDFRVLKKKFRALRSLLGRVRCEETGIPRFCHMNPGMRTREQVLKLGVELQENKRTIY